MQSYQKLYYDVINVMLLSDDVTDLFVLYSVVKLTFCYWYCVLCLFAELTGAASILTRRYFNPAWHLMRISGEFVIRFCLLGAFLFFSYYLLIEALSGQLIKQFFLLLFPRISVWLKKENIDRYIKTHPIL